jgi:hypothetical protein
MGQQNSKLYEQAQHRLDVASQVLGRKQRPGPRDIARSSSLAQRDRQSRHGTTITNSSFGPLETFARLMQRTG